jgi:hypothetical protein
MAGRTQDSKPTSLFLAAPEASESTAGLCEEHEMSNMQQEENKNENSVKQEEAPEYPPTWKVALTMAGLCFAIFCMALVRPSPNEPNYPSKIANHHLCDNNRTTRF